MTALWRRLFKQGLPADFTGELVGDESVLAQASVRGGGHLIATTLGLWLPGPRRVGWHLISKATWSGGALAVVEAVEEGAAGAAVVLVDLPPQRFALEEPGKVPEAVHARVTASFKSKHHVGDAWYLQRKVPGKGGVVLQVRPDPGADVEAVRVIAADVAAKIGDLKPAE
ncbi:hypothetical protein [Umezawaea sp. Da 62-37]|uniref:hypothetical protein n=1 Tax=Umezawaea sp. Da 62-37 TaxID=3075927 RepID=UPI0028F6E169|nr:hypothetical protein [Umezawaea sp. Da 62-37]WNV83396.1 hypothetical protein RM788_35165 [Umezawaea sp. Da 62-37]